MTRGTRLQIRPAALRHNARRARALAGNAEVYAMVKANGYGHGLLEVAAALRDEADGFGVAVMEEAVALREAGISSRISLLEGCFDAGEWRLAAQLDLEVVIHSPEQVASLREAGVQSVLHVWLKVDTGMHRLGVPCEAVPGVLAALSAMQSVRVDGLMTHFACADQREDPLSETQLQRLRALADEHDLPWCAANSAGLLRYPDCRGARVRPGIMLYGASPLEETTAQELDLKVTQRLVAPVMAIVRVPAGDTVGYGGSWRAGRDSVIGVVAIGYGDGYPRHAANGAPVALNGTRTHIVGRVSMDMVTIDLTDIPDAKIGDEVELWGDTISVDEVARFCGTISYELFCQITSRPRRELLHG